MNIVNEMGHLARMTYAGLAKKAGQRCGLKAEAGEGRRLEFEVPNTSAFESRLSR